MATQDRRCAVLVFLDVLYSLFGFMRIVPERDLAESTETCKVANTRILATANARERKESMRMYAC